MAVDISPERIRAYISDSIDANLLLDRVQFTDARIEEAKMATMSFINITPPLTSYDWTGLPDAVDIISLYGTLFNLFLGESALAARNQMSYSDGGLTIPIEERFQYWVELSSRYEAMFKSMLKDWKIAVNMESGWGEVRSDFARFPYY